MPRIVEAPLPFAPHHCLATNRDDGELIDFEADANINEPFPHVVLMRGVVEEAARECCGMVSAEALKELERKYAAWAEKLEEVLKERDLVQSLAETQFGKELEGTTPTFTGGPIEIEAASPAGTEED